MNSWSVILAITRTHLFSRFKQTATAGLGVTFGIGTFITLMSFMTGLNGLLDGLILNRTPHIHLYNEITPSEKQPLEIINENAPDLLMIKNIKPKRRQARIRNALPIIEHLEDDPQVKGVTAQVQAQVFYLAGTIQLNGLVTGLDPIKEKQLFNFGDYIVKGSPEDLEKNKTGILLGAGVAKKMSKEVGDRIQVKNIDGELFSLKIIGFYQSGLAEIDDIQSYVNLGMAQQLNGEGNQYITDIHVKLYDLEMATIMAPELEKIHGITAVDIKTANAQFETGTTIRNLITYAVSCTLLLVAGFGIYNILNMLIYEKMNDIAILKATGFTGADVRNIFISQALLIGLAGGVIGLGIGFVLSVLISQTPFETEALPTIKTFPVNFNPWYYIIGILFALISTFLAGFLPARKAAKIDPVDIIRGQ